MEYINQILHGNSLSVLQQLPDESIDTGITSPPYYGLRQYDGDPIIWGGDAECLHEWSDAGSAPTKNAYYGSTDDQKQAALVASMRNGGQNQKDNPPNVGANRKMQESELRKKGARSSFCVKCGAWYGMLGLETSPELYIDHLVLIFRDLRRVLRNDATLWLNISDSYAGSWGSHKEHHYTSGEYHVGKGAPVYGKDEGWCPASQLSKYGYKPKDLIGIPHMLVTALRNDGWWWRSTIIWRKVNCMPSSAQDRPTTDFEYIFLLAKNGEKPLFWTHEDGYGSRTKPEADYFWKDMLTGEEQNTEPEGDWRTEVFSDPKKVVMLRRWKRRNLWKGHAYYYNGDAIKEPMADATRARDKYGYNGAFKGQFVGTPGEDRHQDGKPIEKPFFSDSGRNKRTVWEEKSVFDRSQQFQDFMTEKLGVDVMNSLIRQYNERLEDESSSFLDVPTTSFSGAHFAVFPSELIIPMILAGSPEKVCPVCGAGFLPRKVKTGEFQRRWGTKNQDGSPYTNQSSMQAIYQDKGLQPTCACLDNDGSGVGVVLDPFCGSGTTLMVAKQKHRRWVGIDASLKYVTMSERRVEEAEPEHDPDVNQLKLEL